MANTRGNICPVQTLQSIKKVDAQGMSSTHKRIAVVNGGLMANAENGPFKSSVNHTRLSLPSPQGRAMPISDIPILSMLRTRLQWHQERQHILAETVANADTPV
jgi:hypothetical protein